MNVKEALLMSGVTIIGFGTVQIQHDLLQGTILIAVGCAILAFRGWVKEQ